MISSIPPAISIAQFPFPAPLGLDTNFVILFDRPISSRSIRQREDFFFISSYRQFL
jgi:hypothetical protein